MDSISLLLMALLSLNTGTSSAAEDEVAVSARAVRTKCVIAARDDANRTKQILQSCNAVPAQSAKQLAPATVQRPEKNDTAALTENRIR